VEVRPATRTNAAALIERFEQVYRAAEGDPERIPWAHEGPNRSLVPWLNVEAPAVVRPGGRVLVVGCGLGHDAAELAARGFDVSAIDVCPSAIDYARRLHPELSGRFQVADAMDPPPRLLRRFDLVVEVHTLQSLPPASWQDLAKAIASTLCHRGVLLSVCRGRPDDAPLDAIEGPPFALTPNDMLRVWSGAGLAPIRALDDFLDENRPPVRRLRGAFRRQDA
jgi:SAM-dependent methyltransferase